MVLLLCQTNFNYEHLLFDKEKWGFWTQKKKVKEDKLKERTSAWASVELSARSMSITSGVKFWSSLSGRRYLKRKAYEMYYVNRKEHCDPSKGNKRIWGATKNTPHLTLFFPSEKYQEMRKMCRIDVQPKKKKQWWSEKRQIKTRMLEKFISFDILDPRLKRMIEIITVNKSTEEKKTNLHRWLPTCKKETHDRVIPILRSLERAPLAAI